MKKSLFISLILIIFVNICIAPVSYGWVLRGSNDTFTDVAYGNNICVAIGANGVIYRSIDNAATWSKVSYKIRANQNIRTGSITFGKGKFIVAWDNGIITTSTDGTHWNEIVIEEKIIFGQVVYGNNKFVVTSYGNGTFSSENGIDWKRTLDADATWQPSSLAYGNNKFVMIKSTTNKSLMIYTSTDGDTWNSTTSNDMGYGDILYFIKDKFIITGYHDLFYSYNGEQWNKTSQQENYSQKQFIYGNNKILKIEASYPYPTLYSSVDDYKTWTKITTLDSYSSRIIFVNGQFINLSYDGIQTSYDGIKWVTRLSKSDKNFQKINFSNGRFIAIGVGRKSSFTSVNGINWIENSFVPVNPQYPKNYINGGRLFDIVYGNNQQIAVGEKGEIFASQDGASWAQVNSGTDKWLDSVLYINELNAWVIAGWGGTILTSLNNGSTWNKESVPTEYPLLGIAHGNGQIVMIGANGVVITSKDGNNAWNRGYIGNDNWYYDITYGRGMFVAVGDNGKIMTSQDGSKWVEEVSNSVNQLNSIIFSNNQFYVVGNKGTLLTSYNGIIWKSEQLPIVENINSIAYDNTSRQFVLVGDNGAILTTK